MANDEDAERWHARQMELAGTYRLGQELIGASGSDELIPITRELAALMWKFHDDEAFWDLLEEHVQVVSRLADDQRVLAIAATSIDWVPFLTEAGFEPPPPVDRYADEFRMDVRAALEHPGDLKVKRLRRRVADLATRLDRDLADDRPGRLARLGAAVAASLPGVLRAGLASQLTVVTSTVATAALIPVLGPFAAAAGPAAGAMLSAGVVEGLQRAFAEKREFHIAPNSADLSAFVRDQFRPDSFGHFRSNVLAIVELSVGYPPETSAYVVSADLGPMVFSVMLNSVDNWLAAALVAWDHSMTNAPQLLAVFERLTCNLGRIRALLAGLESDMDLLRTLVGELENDFNAILHDLGSHS